MWGHDEVASMGPVAMLLCLLLANCWRGYSVAAWSLGAARQNMVTQGQCLEAAIPSMGFGCADGTLYVNGSSDLGFTQALIRLLHTCNLTTFSTAASLQRPVRMLLPPGDDLRDVIASVASTYSSLTQVQVQVEAPPDYATFTQRRYASITNSNNESMTHEVWLVTLAESGAGVSSGAYMRLEHLNAAYDRLQPESLLPAMRYLAMTYNEQVDALPLTTRVLSLYYNRQVFQQNGWQPPSTWWELVALARRINGTNGQWAFSAAWECGLVNRVMARAILASYIQTQGWADGWLIDPATMRPLLDTPATDEMLRILKELYTYSAPWRPVNQTASCWPESMGFEQGRALMTISWPTTFKYVSHISRAGVVGDLQGNLGVAPLPGSDLVLDRTTNKLRPCTPNTCPYSTQQYDSNGSSMSVNWSPTFDAYIFHINNNAPDALRFFAFSLTSYLVTPTIASRMLFHPDTALYPSRTSHLRPEAWAAAGFNLADAQQFCSAYGASVDHKNLHMQVRIPGADQFLMLQKDLAEYATSANGSLTNDAIAVLRRTAQARAMQTLKDAFNGDWALAKQQYQLSLTYVGAEASSPPLGGPSTPSTDTAQVRDSLIITAIAVPVSLVGGIIVVLLLTRRFLKRNRRRALHPEPGPSTTLLITDIENSTPLWECLAPDVLDLSAKLHNQCIRRIVAQHQGYESAWEGDSFIIAFAHPLPALKCAMQLQRELLHVAWPADLLASPYARPVWMQPLTPGSSMDALRGRPKRAASISQASLSGSEDPGSHFGPVHDPHWQVGEEEDRHGQGGSELHSVASAGSMGRVEGLFQTVGLDSSSNGSVQTSGVSGYDAAGLLGGGEVQGSGARGLEHHQHTGGLEQEHQQQQQQQLVVTASHPVRANASSSPSRAASAEAAAATGGSDAPGDMPWALWAGRDAASRSGRLRTAAVAAAAAGGAEPCTFGQLYQRLWATCSSETPRAVLAYRGLRVRVGMHAGSKVDGTYNHIMCRWHYTGPLRITAYALAAAGHGGQTLLDTSTAALLGLDAKGGLAGLPEEVKLVHRGRHQLLGMEGGEAVTASYDLLCAQPQDLACRTTLLDKKELRKTRQLLPGFMDAPMRAPDGGSLYLACVQLKSMHQLLSWDMQEALGALAAAQGCALQAAAVFGGLVSEDGWEPAGVAQLSKAQLSALPARRMMVVFQSARDAVGWAVSVRNGMLALPWSGALLAHSGCEQLGDLPAGQCDPEASTHWHALNGKRTCYVWRTHGSASGAAGAMGKLPQAAWDKGPVHPEHPADPASPRISAALIDDVMLQTPSHDGSSQFRPSPDVAASGLSGRIVKVVAPWFPRLSVDYLRMEATDRCAGNAQHGHSPYSSSLGNIPNSSSFANICSSSSLVHMAPGPPRPGGSSPAMLQDPAVGELAGVGPRPYQQACQQGSQQGQGSQGGAPPSKHAGSSSSLKLISAHMKSLLSRKARGAPLEDGGGSPACAAPAAPAPASAAPARGQKCILVHDAPALRGLRVSAAVVAGGALRAQLASTGRVVYSGQGPKQLHKLLKLTSAGQVICTMEVLSSAAGCSGQQEH